MAQRRKYEMISGKGQDAHEQAAELKAKINN